MADHYLDYCDTYAKRDSRTKVRFAAQVLVCAFVFCVASLNVHAEQKSPEEVYAGRPNNLEQLPAGWITQNPIELVVSFNLKSAPNSPESNSFLQTWYKTISDLPHDIDLKVQRPVSPSGFTYAVSLTFNNWEEYREYESSEAFLAYYYEYWKPLVDDAEERVFILDSAASLSK